MKRVLAAVAGVTMAASAAAQAAQVSIDFDIAQANYTPLSQGVSQVITDQFEPLGIIFSDASNGLGVVVDDLTGGVGSDPVHLYGNNGSNGADVTPNIRIDFVLPGTGGQQGFSDFFSILITDGNGTVLSGFDSLGNMIGSVTTVGGGFNERLTLENIGLMAFVRVMTPNDFTGYDDIVFGSPIADAAVPVPAAALLFAPAALAFARRKKR